MHVLFVIINPIVLSQIGLLLRDQFDMIAIISVLGRLRNGHTGC